MSDVKRRKVSHGDGEIRKKKQKNERPKSPSPAAEDSSSEEESATIDVPSNEESPETPKTFAELVQSPPDSASNILV